MADRISDDQVADLLRVIRSDVSVDVKVQHVNIIKSGIKQHNVPDHLVAQVAEGLRTASSSQHGILVNAGFTAFNHLLTRLSRQDPRYLTKEVKGSLPVVVDKLGDPKEKLRSLAAQALTTLYAVAPADVERSVRNIAMVGKNSRAKEAGMQWVLQMHQEHGLQFRGYVPTLMDLLEDADGMVRDVAKSTVIELFRNAPNTAKSDLKRQLKNFKVRPAIEQAIVKELAPTGGRPETPMETTTSVPAARPPSRANLASSMSALSIERPITPAIEVKAEAVEPAYVNTARELEDTFREMHMFFDGKETEQNWFKREESMTKLRRYIAGNAAQDFREPFLTHLRSLLDGIIKAIISLRTSLSKEGCALVQDIANAFGPGMDPLVELLMQTFIKLAAATKKIISQLANTVVETILSKVTYNTRLMQHVYAACQDKNVQPRTYASGWLQILLKKEGHHKSHMEHGGGLELIEKSIKRGLNDANPGVRERMRGTYWLFSTIWPARAELIMENLDGTAQKLLQKDSNNPNAAKKAEAAPVARPGLGLSRSTMTSSKPSLREAMLAQKRAMASKNLPARPGSAMAHLSPSRSVSGTSTASAATATTSTTGTTRTRPESTAVSGGMSVRPMRPAKRRPDIAPRPATAGPYSVRSHPGAEAPSPETLKSKLTANKPTLEASPRRTAAPRPRPGHASHASESSIPSPTAAKTPIGKPSATPTASPYATPVRARQTPVIVAPASPEVEVVEAEEADQPAPAADDEEQPAPASPEPEAVELPPSPPKLAQPEASPVRQTPVRESPAIHSPVRLSPAKPSPAPPSPSAVRLSPSKESSTPSKSLKVFEDPFTDEDQSSTPKPTIVLPVLEDRPVNEIVPVNGAAEAGGLSETPDKSGQNARLLESGITRVKARSLDVHGFRKLQTLIRENRAVFTDDKFDALLVGLFEFLEAPVVNTTADKGQDIKAQILATIKLLLKKQRDSFQPHVSRGLESLIATRSGYDSRTHIVSGLELLAEELVTLGDAAEIAVSMTKLLKGYQESTSEGARSLSMGLHILRELLEKREAYVPSDSERGALAGLAARCLESAESGVRMGAVQLCVALHGRIGDGPFWDAVKDAKDDPKNLITYYIAKKQRETAASGV
ncbi:clasp N terminal-domain-containing protein [Plectosphaerella plurivora]|uniref:Clasp N terminal-domain-containing protein n=1 Tax=Plectosphaerella plurivora TaxID=936078 RepID=A0A9P9AEW6_9PEZI|nr:clasp N terminal-domain-containing protein [Plectosphaerella plurivora]